MQAAATPYLDHHHDGRDCDGRDPHRCHIVILGGPSTDMGLCRRKPCPPYGVLEGQRLVKKAIGISIYITDWSKFRLTFPITRSEILNSFLKEMGS